MKVATTSFFFVATVATSLDIAQTQDSSSLGWDPSYRLDYTYDEGDDGLSWQNVNELGEWGKEEYTNFNIQSRGNVCASSSGGDSPITAENRRPSPINLFQTSRCQDMHELLTRQMSDGSSASGGNERDCGMEDVKYDITPYGLKIYFPTSDDVCKRPTIRSSRTNPVDPYVLLWMELHIPSEHVIDGKRYHGELQMVHRGIGQEEGQLLTVSVLISTEDTTVYPEHENLQFQYMLQEWTKVVTENQSKCDEFRRTKGRNVREITQETENETEEVAGNRILVQQQQEQSIADDTIVTTTTTTTTTTENKKNDQTESQRNLQFSSPSICRTDKYGDGCEPLGPRRRMYPYNLWPSIWYFGYSGSLTSPPCTDIVNWFVIDEPMKISTRQYKEVAKLLKSYQHPDDNNCSGRTATDKRVGSNNRPLQTMNPATQSIYHCTIDNFGYYVYPPEEQ